MTDRERWIVYPLLFLALGAALRDKLGKQTRTKQLLCEQMVLVDAEGRPAAVLTGGGLEFDSGAGYIKANTIDAQGLFQRGHPVLSMAPRQGLSLQQLLQLLPQVQLTPAPPAEEPQPEAAPPLPGQDPSPEDETPGSQNSGEAPGEESPEPAPAA